MLINDPVTLAAITDAWNYEKALMTNDIEALDDFFWTSEFERLAAFENFGVPIEAVDPSLAAIIMSGKDVTAVDAFRGIYALEALRRRTEAEWAKVDLLLLPTAPTIYKVADMLAEPILLNSRLGTYTNFFNLLDLSTPATSTGDDRLNIAVGGAHLSGMALHHELIALDAALVAWEKTTGDYRLFVLPNTVPPKPGLIRDANCDGPGIEIEIWSLTPAAFGRFVERIPAPLGIGKVSLVAGARCRAS